MERENRAAARTDVDMAQTMRFESLEALEHTLRRQADESMHYQYQQPGRGMAVTGYVFSLFGLFSLGFLPPVSALGIVCSCFAASKRNRSSLVYLGVAIGVIGLILSIYLYVTFRRFSLDPLALQELLGASSGA